MRCGVRGGSSDLAPCCALGFGVVLGGVLWFGLYLGFRCGTWQVLCILCRRVEKWGESGEVWGQHLLALGPPSSPQALQNSSHKTSFFCSPAAEADACWPLARTIVCVLQLLFFQILWGGGVPAILHILPDLLRLCEFTSREEWPAKVPRELRAEGSSSPSGIRGENACPTL